MRKKISYVIEIIWLVLSIACLAAGIHKTNISGFGNSYLFFILAFIAILMFMFRRYLRKSQSTKSEDSDE